jgi:NADH dehydrogenase FAD-containing subunit
LLPKFNKRAQSYVTKWLEEHNVEVILNETVSNPRSPRDSRPGEKITQYKLETSGRTIKADKSFFCTGGKPTASSFMEKYFGEHISKEGFINVNEYFQLKGYPNIFAVGDIVNSAEEKLGERAVRQADLVIDHVRRTLADKAPKKKYTVHTKPPMLVVSLGENNAMIAAHFKYVAHGAVPAKMKMLFLTKVASWLRSSVSESARVEKEALSKLPTPPALTDQTVLLLGGWTMVGYNVARQLASHGVKLKVAMIPGMQQKRETLEKMGASVIEFDYENPKNTSLLYNNVDIGS